MTAYNKPVHDLLQPRPHAGVRQVLVYETDGILPSRFTINFMRAPNPYDHCITVSCEQDLTISGQSVNSVCVENEGWGLLKGKRDWRWVGVSLGWDPKERFG